MRELETAVEEAVASHTQAVVSERHYQDKLNEKRAKVGALAQKQEILEEEYTNWRTLVEQRFGEELQVTETAVYLERKLKAKRAAFERSQQEQGQTPEEIEEELTRATTNYEKAKSDFTQLHNLITMMRRSMAIRQSRWQEFRKFMSLRCKLCFQYYLAERGFFGQIQLDHDKKTLALSVQTDDQKTKDGKGKAKDAKSMSGGEKSFSTICLLLSLWDAMNCPIRALDEFDVYMDAVNRKISMKMMLDVAKNSDKQHILITPQEMGNIQLGPEIRVHRMHDPERGQQTLRFQA
ncbi:Structural maintenance of chromosomes protein 6 [Serendipita sp. 411]|nr:Structural maintenance of chromosomes protein 6 [Serendipita sp. 411]